MAQTSSRLLPSDVLRAGASGLRTRRLRAALSALGIAIGIASMVGVLGISESSKSDLLATLDRLGTNLLRATPGQEIFTAETATLPRRAAAMVGRIGPVTSVSATQMISDATVRRTDYVDANETGGISVVSADLDLLDALGGAVREGRYLDAAAARYPTVVLGSVAAERLGIDDLSGRVRVWINDQWFTVIGILEPMDLASEIDRSALVGKPAARKYLDATGNPTALYVRAEPDDIDAVRSVLAPTANAENPEEVSVERPSDALEARAAAKTAFTSLFVGLGAVALLVGGVGIANVMVISVLERRSEIGLRRALGATARHIWSQFLTESLILAVVGGAVGAAVGAAIAAVYASTRGWTAVVPGIALAGGLVAALVIGAMAGLYPAWRASRMVPTEALRSV